MSGVKCRETPLHSDTDEKGYDETDKPPVSYHVTYFDIGSLIYSLVFHFADVGVDFYVAHAYYSTRKFSHFAWTLAFILVPSIILTLVSVRMYVKDCNGKTNNRRNIIRIVLCVLGTFFQLALPIRFFDSFLYARKSLKAEKQSNRKEQEKYFLKMLNEDSDVALLKVFECYLESAPQQVLQITLLVLDYIEGSSIHSTKQIVMITLGFLSMGWCMANYHRCIRFDQEEKKNISALGIVVQFFWHFNFTVSRILAITALATLYATWTCVAAVIHWFIMTVWVGLRTEFNFCGNKILETFFHSAVGIVYIFSFLNMKEGSTKNSYIFFYLSCFIENVIAVTIWGIKATHLVKSWIYYFFIVLPILCFAFSVGFLLLYYQYLHPNKLKSGFNNDRNTLYVNNGCVNSHDQRTTLTGEPNQ